MEYGPLDYMKARPDIAEELTNGPRLPADLVDGLLKLDANETRQVIRLMDAKVQYIYAVESTFNMTYKKFMEG